MGGYGSGRRDHKKQTVENCRALDIVVLSRGGILERGTWRSGALRWTAASGDKCASVGFHPYTLFPLDYRRGNFQITPFWPDIAVQTMITRMITHVTKNTTGTVSATS